MTRDVPMRLVIVSDLLGRGKQLVDCLLAWTPERWRG